ncbi:ribbon-helix-helix domain-containing protein [Jiella avicenniae]|uniref:Type II toxin-antitoxin system ParD family antitoxin n=1 Tax=Jiella avicenniae TaxID=2907202 RepID=A0A9X1NZP4_9HYPH|nr:type II toxin-antitoxin system ParD family antitoxin [Jiella avicenniae]MCE7027301.1 type II toxin-antitoxin system ParD family antitoxin [Jiella avicenniae]
MAQEEKLSISVSAELAAALRTAVASGEYASQDEVMSEALRDWQIRRTDRHQARQELGRLWDEGLASGLPTDGEAAFARIRRRVDGRLASGDD